MMQARATLDSFPYDDNTAGDAFEENADEIQQREEDEESYIEYVREHLDQ